MPTTTLIADEHVDAYLRDLTDLLARVIAGNAIDASVTICAIGASGAAIAKSLARLIAANAAMARQIRWIASRRDNKSGTVTFDKSVVFERDLRNRLVLVLDSAVHTGSTMETVCDAVLHHRAASVMSYSLVLKNRSRFVPTGWGLLIGEQERALFLLKRLPNALLVARRPTSAAGIGSTGPTIDAGFHLAMIGESASRWAEFESGQPLLDRITWADRLARQARPYPQYRCYALISGGMVCGLVGFEVVNAECHIHEVAVSRSHRRRGFGAALIQWAERAAREAGCTGVRFEAIDDTVSLYRKLGFRVVLDAVGQPQVVRIGSYRMTTMRRSLARGADWRD